MPTTQPEPLRRPSTAVTSPHRLGRAIRQARTELGWTRAELANRTGVARAQISAIETARGNRATFVYSDEYLASTSPAPLSVSIPLGEGTYDVEDAAGHGRAHG
ncbi:MAG: helix-turn-helix domain-containing protein [Acidimicrobiia bacterium]|nr:helix-turn-helix domain-containing protein [Acidimicrobiia bacterium]